MFPRLLVLLLTVRSSFKTQHQLALENLALRQQLAMLRQSVKRPRVSWFDRVFWAIFARFVERWRALLHTLHPDTVVRWHREGFRGYWRRKSRRRSPGRLPIDHEVRKLIRHTHAIGQHRLGCAAHPQRAAQARHRDLPSDGLEVHGPLLKTTVTNLADLSQQPCEGYRRDRFLGAVSKSCG